MPPTLLQAGLLPAVSCITDGGMVEGGLWPCHDYLNTPKIAYKKTLHKPLILGTKVEFLSIKHHGVRSYKIQGLVL